MAPNISIPARFTQNALLKEILLICGILSSLLYVAMNVFVAIADPEYNSASQTVSELSAIDAPTRSLWVPWSFVYTFLVVAFGWGVWLSAGGMRIIRIVGALIFAYGALGFGWPFVPMHLREVLASGGGTLTDTMHLIFAGVTVVIMLLAIGFGAAALGSSFRLYSILTILIQALFGILTGLDAPKLEANLPTPWIGVWERINIGIFLLWVIVLAIALLRKEKASRAILVN